MHGIIIKHGLYRTYYVVGKYTVPVLWDKKTSRIVNNESAMILRMLNTEFNQWATGPHKDIDLYPSHLQADIDSVNEWVRVLGGS